MTKNRANYPGFCDSCRPLAEVICQGNPIMQRKVGQFLEKHLHAQTHKELIRLYNIRKGIWASLPAFLYGAEDIGEAAAT